MFNKLRSAILLCLCSLVLFSCDKEYSVEGFNIGGGTTGGTSVFTLDGAPGTCNGASVQGTYTGGVATTAVNYVVITANVTALGTYTLTTNTADGFSYAASGSFTNLGFQLVQLNAVGTPTSGGTITFRAGSASCSFTVTVGAGSGGSGGGGSSSGTAVYVFNGNPGNCATPAISGTYQQGTALTAANKVVLKANVTTAGTYLITTSNNGMTFTASGTFTATGANQDVTFTGSGTPTASGNINFLSGAVASGCTFTIPVIASGGGGGGTTFLKATINGVAYEFNTNLIGSNSSATPATLTAGGSQSLPAGGSGTFDITFINSTGTLSTGAYSNPSLSNPTKYIAPSYSPSTGVLYSLQLSPTAPANTFTGNLTTYTATAATGTFTGTLYLIQGTGPATLPLTNGSFSVTY